MKQKTISGHYDKAYSIEHNNRMLISSNVDPRRSGWNYNCVAAGLPADLDPNDPGNIREYWSKYKELSQIYWADRDIHLTLANTKYREHQEYMRRYYRALYELSNNPVGALIELLLLPYLIIKEVKRQLEYQEVKAEYEAMKQEQLLRDLAYKATRVSLRKALYDQDLETGTKYLHTMDHVVTEMAACADDYLHIHPDVDLTPQKEIRYATIEEVYEKVFEPSFREFQKKQRPCRRYNGTCLEQIREKEAKERQKKQQTNNVKRHSTAEAIEIVFGIGDMDNTGYYAAYEDARYAEELLRDFCDHLMTLPNICTITTKELKDPDWQPPIKNGLIILNLTVHADEATPGVHLTVIPYSRGCKRGPDAQTSMGRAMTGMGYPSTWKDVLDKNGQKIPKRNKSGEIICNKDGSIRYKQEPDRQGIIDWIEDQKSWIHQEMRKRYDWEREYKGSHPRGNLSTPDYKVARAIERRRENEKLIEKALNDYEDRVYDLSVKLDDCVSPHLAQDTNRELIERYLRVCSDDEYEAVVNRAYDYLEKLAEQEQERAQRSLFSKIMGAEARNVLKDISERDKRELII